MLATLLSLKSRTQSFLHDDTGVVAWEYLLVIAAVTVAVFVAITITPPVLSSVVITATCGAIDVVIPGAPMTCTF